MFYQFQHFGISESFSKEYGRNFSFPVHLHQFYEFIVITSGEMEISVDGKSYILKKGEAVLIFPHQLHSLNGGNSEHILCIFSPELISAFASKNSARLPVNNMFTPNKYLIDVLDELSDTASTFEKKGLLYSLCAGFDKAAEYKERTYGQDHLIFKIFEFVENNYLNDCSLNMLAEKTHFSYSYLSRYFKKTTGISFNEYVNQYRISKASYLLTNSDITIIKCAYDVGYRSLRSFNRNFKLYTGITPHEYKAKI